MLNNTSHLQEATVRRALRRAHRHNCLAIKRTVDVWKQDTGQRRAGRGGRHGRLIAHFGCEAVWVNVEHQEFTGQPAIEAIGHLEQGRGLPRAVDETICAEGRRYKWLVGRRGGKLEPPAPGDGSAPPLASPRGFFLGLFLLLHAVSDVVPASSPGHAGAEDAQAVQTEHR